ncbi:MAG: lysozyme inhibitor LprI family protein [Pseudomonadota bacterium]
MKFLLTKIALLTAASAQAQDLSFDSIHTEACLEEAVGVAERHACIGASANQCMETPSGSSTVGMGFCLSEEWQFWDARLNNVYQQLRRQQADAEPVLNERLQEMQRAWITFRDARCDYEFVQWGGGTGGGPALSACLMQATAEQVFVLEQNLR